jgi:hypothetical protein
MNWRKVANELFGPEHRVELIEVVACANDTKEQSSKRAVVSFVSFVG